MCEIREFQETDTKEVIKLALHCQNDGSRPVVSLKDQPDLLCIREKYIDAGGNFWVALADGKIAGSIGLMNGGSGIGILKKFFVYEPYRGYPHHLGQRLYRVLISCASKQGYKQIILDTPKNTCRAHNFYKKAGFHKIEKTDLPFLYAYPYADSDFFRLNLTDDE